MFFSMLLSFLLLVTTNAVAADVHVGLVSNFSEISTGTSNLYGGYFKDGAQFALEKLKSKLDQAHLKIVFDEFDYGMSDVRVLEAAKKAVQSPVVAVMGYGYSVNALLAAPIHHDLKLPMLTPSASANRLSDFGRYVHIGSFSNKFMGESLAMIASQKLKLKRVLLLPALNCAYCTDLSTSFESGFKNYGGEIVKSIPILTEDKEFSDLIKMAKSLKFDAVLVPNQELSSARVISAFVNAGIKTTFLGGDGWGENGQEFTGVLKNLEFTGYSTSHWSSDIKTQQFSSDYKKRFGSSPNDTSVLAFDSMTFLLNSIIKAKAITREGVEDALNSQSTFEGVSGTFQCSPNKAPKKKLVLLKVSTGGKAKKLEVITPSGGV